ncbi:hypothetical protein BDR26DRAFT_855838 [Obelidium mucronatum]|nr:hypothetical protein BDR26DRAFT_855838 [Obelidium mucronatum]
MADSETNSGLLDTSKVLLKEFSHNVKGDYLKEVLFILAVQYLAAFLSSYIFIALLPGTSWWTSRLLSLGGLLFSQLLYKQKGNEESSREFLIVYTIYESYACSYASSLLGMQQNFQFLLMLSIHWFFGMSLFTLQNKAKYSGYAPYVFGAGVVAAMILLLEDGGVLGALYLVYLFAHTMITFREKLDLCTPKDVMFAVVDWNMYLIPLVNVYFLFK